MSSSQPTARKSVTLPANEIAFWTTYAKRKGLGNFTHLVDHAPKSYESRNKVMGLIPPWVCEEGYAAYYSKKTASGGLRALIHEIVDEFFIERSLICYRPPTISWESLGEEDGKAE